MLKPLTVWITTNCKILQEMGIPDHLTCLLRNLCSDQEATVRLGTTDWFQIGKGLHQGCVLSPCLFKLYAEYIIRNPGLDEAQARSRLPELYAEYIIQNPGLDEAQARSRLPGEISITSDIQMAPTLWQKAKRN